MGRGPPASPRSLPHTASGTSEFALLFFSSQLTGNLLSRHDFKLPVAAGCVCPVTPQSRWHLVLRWCGDMHAHSPWNVHKYQWVRYVLRVPSWHLQQVSLTATQAGTQAGSSQTSV
jgi:hypothetical protein